MAGCPFRNFQDCPQHSKTSGCELWMTYSGSKDSLESRMEGCALALAPMLLLENANCLGLVAGEVQKVGAEVSASRVESIAEGTALRRQFVSLARGRTELVEADHSKTLTMEVGNGS